MDYQNTKMDTILPQFTHQRQQCTDCRKAGSASSDSFLEGGALAPGTILILNVVMKHCLSTGQRTNGLSGKNKHMAMHIMHEDKTLLVAERKRIQEILTTSCSCRLHCCTPCMCVHVTWEVLVQTRKLGSPNATVQDLVHSICLSLAPLITYRSHTHTHNCVILHDCTRLLQPSTCLSMKTCMKLHTGFSSFGKCKNASGAKGHYTLSIRVSALALCIHLQRVTLPPYLYIFLQAMNRLWEN